MELIGLRRGRSLAAWSNLIIGVMPLAAMAMNESFRSMALSIFPRKKRD